MDNMIKEEKTKKKSHRLVDPNPNVVVKFERFMKKCDYRWKLEKNDTVCCGYHGREKPKACNAYNCPEVDWIVDDIQIMDEEERKITYIS